MKPAQVPGSPDMLRAAGSARIVVRVGPIGGRTPCMSLAAGRE